MRFRNKEKRLTWLEISINVELTNFRFILNIVCIYNSLCSAMVG